MIERGLTAVFIRTGLIILLIGLALVVPPDRIHACSCAPLEPPARALEKSAAVFAGSVVSIDEDYGGEYPVTIEFDVTTVWKGPDHQTAYLRTSSGGGLCGFRFALDLEYLVYSQDGVRVSACSRTRNLVGASDDLAVLGVGRSPAPGSVGPTPDVSEYRRGGGCGLAPSSTDVFPIALLAGMTLFGLVRKLSRSE